MVLHDTVLVIPFKGTKAVNYNSLQRHVNNIQVSIVYHFVIEFEQQKFYILVKYCCEESWKKMLNKRDLVTIKGLICSSMYSASLDYILATSLYYSAQCIFHQGHFSYWGQAQLGSGLWQIGHATIMFTLNSWVAVSEYWKK